MGVTVLIRFLLATITLRVTGVLFVCVCAMDPSVSLVKPVDPISEYCI